MPTLIRFLATFFLRLAFYEPTLFAPNGDKGKRRAKTARAAKEAREAIEAIEERR